MHAHVFLNVQYVSCDVDDIIYAKVHVSIINKLNAIIQDVLDALHVK